MYLKRLLERCSGHGEAEGPSGADRGYASVLLTPSEPEEVAEPVGDQAARP